MRYLARSIAFVLVLAVAAPAAAAETKGALPEGYPEAWYARIETNLGTIVARLLPVQAPQSVAHFAAFARGAMTWTDITTGAPKTGPYYDGLTVHRITPAERFEVGDPTGTGRGAPLVYVPIEVGGPMNFDRPYRIGLTRAARGRINGAMFFVTCANQPFLSASHPCIAEVVAGRDVADAICGMKLGSDGKSLTPVTIEHVRILKSGNPLPLPDPVPYTPPVPQLEPRPH